MTFKQFIRLPTVGLITAFLAMLVITPVCTANADTSQEFGDYTVHFNAFNSDVLQPAMAEAYGIVRSKNRGMMTISILKKGPEGTTTPVRASVTATASNLTGQFRQFNIREINDSNSIYYISVFHVAHEEMLDFTLQILPEGETKTHTVTFRQQFYTH